jgi:hypothetical protein
MDPFSIVIGVVQITAGAITAAGQISRICEGIRDKDHFLDFLNEVKHCAGNLDNIKSLFDHDVNEWLHNDPPRRTIKAIESNFEQMRK